MVELICSECGERFLSRHSISGAALCPYCRREVQHWREAEQGRREAERRRTEKAQFLECLKQWNTVRREDVVPEDERVLYIIGNGFDLMHGVRSSYYSFRDSLGRNNQLRRDLEFYLEPEDIWADFEEALAHFNMRAMCGKFIINEMLEMYDAYDEDAGAAEFHMAAEGAAHAIITVASDLQRRFRMWAESLTVGTDDRPLKQMFQKGKVLCFNYTEFVETLYGVPKDNVCYIHGCRRKQKGRPKEWLVLGHRPGASDDAYDFEDDYRGIPKDPYRRRMIDAAQQTALQIVYECDETLTKNCADIIAAHRPFFASLSNVRQIIVIGHSVSPVDWDYFAEVAAHAPGARWYFGCHGLRDLDNIGQLLAKLSVDPATVTIFRTDDIVVTPRKGVEPTKLLPSGKMRGSSPDKSWIIKTWDRELSVIERKSGAVNYSVMFSTPINDAFFLPDGASLLAVIRGADTGVFLFRLKAGRWGFVDELVGFPRQSLLNSRLNHVYLTEREIAFVYNNRIRRYSLEDARLLSNRAHRNARFGSYKGTEITDLFWKKRRPC